MKTLILAVALLCTNVNAQSLNEVLSLHQDKQLHVGYTYIISSVTTSYVLKKTSSKKKAIIIGIGVGVTIGAIKEIYDSKHGCAQKGDIMADLIGSTLGSIVVTIPFSK